MKTNFTERREFLKRAGWMGSAAMMAGLPEGAMAFGGGAASIVQDAVKPAPAEAAPKYHIKFAVCGMSHDHIFGMIGAVQRGGGELVAAWGGEDDKIAGFRKRFPDVKVVKTQDEILNDPAVQLVLTSQIASERAGLAVRAMKNGKDFLSDKPGITTLEQLADVRKTIAETKRVYAILYSELLEVKAAVYAGELVRQGAIGKGDPDHQYCSAPDFPARRSSWRRRRTTGMVLESGPIWRNPVRHWLAPGGPVSVFHGINRG
jgi:predicted dehydrogenase